MVSPSRCWFAQCRDLDASNRPAKGHPEGGQSLTILKNSLALTVSQGCMPLRAKASVGPLGAAKKKSCDISETYFQSRHQTVGGPSNSTLC